MALFLKILTWPKSLLYLLIPHLAKEVIFLREHIFNKPLTVKYFFEHTKFYNMEHKLNTSMHYYFALSNLVPAYQSRNS